jgi:hypothetical protein
VAVGGACATSPDGITWTGHAGFTPIFTGQAYSVCWTGTQLVAVGGGAVAATSSH